MQLLQFEISIFRGGLVPAADMALTGSLKALVPMLRFLLTLPDDEVSFSTITAALS